jgi:uncharacterized repeat protein (TIGR01451 family)
MNAGPGRRTTRLAALLARVAGAFALAAAFNAAAQTPIGTLISNSATGSATAGATPLASTSNTVTLTVGGGAPGAFSATLTANGNAVAAAGATVDFPHTLTNTGVIADNYNLATLDLGASVTFTSLTILPDANGDGVADSAVPVANPVPLGPGGVFRFVVRATLPASTSGTQGDLRISATSGGNAVVVSNVDRVTLFNPAVQLDCGLATKAISLDRGASPGGPLTITLAYDACSKARQRVVLTDLLPAGMRYVPGSARWSGAPAEVLTDANAADVQGAGAVVYDFGVSAPNTVSAVANNIPAFGIGNFRFQVEIVAGLATGTVVDNGATFTFWDANGARGNTTPTNHVTYTVTGTADLELTGQRLPTATPGSSVVFTNGLTNRGSATDTFDITLSGSTFPAGTTFALFKSDGVTPLADTDGNGTPDTGPVAPNGTYNIIVRAQIPATAPPGAYKVVKTARSANAPTRFVSADDAVDTLATRCQMALDPDNQALSGFGRHVTYVHFLTNRGNCNENVTAMVTYKSDSRPGWTSTAFVDNATAGGASIPGALDATDTPVVPGWTTTLAPGQGLRILVDVLAPTEAEMQLLKSKTAQAKVLVDTNVTTLTLEASNTGALVVRDTTSLDDNKADGTDTLNTIRNHTDPSYQVPTLWAVIGRNAFLRANAPACNAVPDVVEQRIVAITGPNGEREEVTATETGPNTGLFDVPAMPVRLPPVTAGNRVLEGRANDVFEIEVLGCAQRVSGVMTVMEPVSVVFDSRTNTPIASASVMLVVASGAQCATTAAALGNGALAAGNPVVTGADGRYTFTAVPAGDYCVRITAPNGYTFPSKVPWPELISGRNLVVSGVTSGGSYGTPFRQVSAGAIVVDVPLDPAAQDGLFVQKSVSRSVAEVGEFVDYTVTVRNNTGNALDRAPVTLTDDLPAGFAYVRGTARRDTVGAIADPVANASRLTLVLGPMAAGQQVIIHYRVRLGPGSLQGDGVNRVQVSYSANGQTTLSNIATAKVIVVGGVFSERGFILGKVFLDCNANGLQDRGEIGLPDVRLFIEDGTYVLTDGDGKYSFYGLPNRTHVLKVDRTTLPAGARLAASSARHLGDGGSRMVDLKSGELHRGDFAVAGCAPALVEEAKARAKALSAGTDPLAALAGTQLATEARIPVDAKTLPASGVVVPIAQTGAVVLPPTTAAPNSGAALPAPGTERPSPAPRLSMQPALPQSAVPLEKLVPDFDPTLGFVDLKDGDVLPGAQSSIRVKGVAGATFKLTVNGRQVPERQVGKRAVLQDKQVQAWEYIGVELNAGDNEIVLGQVDGFGNARGSVTVRVKAPGRLAKVALEFPAGGGIADGRSAASVVVKLFDDKGVPVTSRTPVSLFASRGLWKVVDPDPAEPGVQTFVEGGRAEFAIQAPLEPGPSVIVVSSGNLKAEARLDFLPELRSLVAAGVVEGIVNMRNISSRALVPTRAADGFEQELRHISKEWNQDKSQAGARAAFFLKGKIKGDFLLTAAYDSDKDVRERLFRDIQPDEFYPVYGDASVRGYDAQSTSRLYVRVDKNRSYLLWGDYTTQSENPVRKLSNYSRTLTGIKQHYENERVSVNAFASRDTMRQVIEELRANGTSGPYELGTRGALVNSEKVEIIVRDRNQPSIILSTLSQARFGDYEIDALTGRILFRAPVSSVDKDLNPVSIRVTYEVDQGGEQFWVAGVDAQVKITERIEVGASYVKDKNPRDPFTLAGANATVKLGDNTYVMGEVARTERGLDNRKGDAARLEVKHESRDLTAYAFAGRTDKDFDNPGSYLSQGRSEAGGKVEYKLREGTSVKAEALRSEDVVGGAVRDGAMVSATQQVAQNLSLEVGVRHAAEKGTPSPVPATPDKPAPAPLPDEVTTVRARLTGAVPGVKNATIYGEAEVDVKDTDRRLLAAGGEYQLPNRGRIYARHEFISSITGPYGLNATERQNTTAIGVDTEYMKDGRMFSEYRIRDAISGGDVEAAFGLKNLWTLAPGVRLGTSVERVHAIAGTGQNENTAVALALEYTANPLWKGSTRLEVRDGHSQDSVLHTVGFAAKIARDWTALVRNAYSLQKTKAVDGGTAGEKTIERLQAGMAYRDTDTDKWNALARFEHRLEDDDTRQGVALKSSTQIISLHADWKPTRPFLLTGRYAAKWTTDRSNGLSTKYRAQVVGGRATWEFAPKWDAAMVTSVMFGDSTASRHYGVGLELGYQVATNLWVSAGYNFFGYRDADLAGADYTAKGAYVRLRFKFDESLIGDKLDPARSAAPAQAAPADSTGFTPVAPAGGSTSGSGTSQRGDL